MSFWPAKPNLGALKLGETAVLGMQLVIFFCSLLLAWPFVNFDVCSIAFVMYLLNGVPFSIFTLILFLYFGNFFKSLERCFRFLNL